MILLSTLSVIRHLICGSNELAVKLESDLQDNVNAEKTQLVSFGQSNNGGAINVKMDGSVFEEKSSFKGALAVFLF